MKRDVAVPRLFSGIEIPADVVERLAALRGGLDGARWVEPENYHITLRFIGDVDGTTAERFSEALNGIKVPAFSVTLDGLGSFGRGRPHAVWAGVAANSELEALSRDHEKAAVRAGLAAETRKFHPHVTLARMRRAKASDVATYLSYNGAFLTDAFPVERFVLFSSRASRGGGPYVVEQAYPLDGDWN